MDELAESIRDHIRPHGFLRHSRPGMAGLGVVGFWRRRTLMSNRAVALVRRPEADFEFGPFCQSLKWKLMRQTLSVPFFYEVGLQIVVAGEGLGPLLDRPGGLVSVVDQYDNQFVVLQSVFAVDLTTHRYSCERTWGQILTGKFQDAIASGIRAGGYAMAGDGEVEAV